MISRVQPTTGALHGDAEKEGSKGLLRSDTQNVSLGYHKNTEANTQDGKQGRRMCEGKLTFLAYGKHLSEAIQEPFAVRSLGDTDPSPWGF